MTAHHCWETDLQLDSSLVTLFADRSELQAVAEKVPYTGVVEINGTADEPDLLLSPSNTVVPVEHGRFAPSTLYKAISCTPVSNTKTKVYGKPNAYFIKNHIFG